MTTTSAADSIVDNPVRAVLVFLVLLAIVTVIALVHERRQSR